MQSSNRTMQDRKYPGFFVFSILNPKSTYGGSYCSGVDSNKW
ncbi:hypothetical protein C943_04066 [Mariniradius saccharolyticus AK6]|uniref:Uncharacterized protein n=1 Tax=Mariniradius saccharolyticus AK6 TaxID=1239962 RepID=M7XI73_9BACT|nr:hypothetical protein C943_04066 [Mariniradius saccharolyticus AK6]